MNISLKAVFILSALLSTVSAQTCSGCIKEDRACTNSPSDCCEGFECQGFNFMKRCQPKLSCLNEWYACNPDAPAEATGCCDSMVCADIGNGMGECRRAAAPNDSEISILTVETSSSTTTTTGTELGDGLSEADLPEIKGPFEIKVQAQFDDLSRYWQRVFDISNGSPSDNVFLTQVKNTNDMGCSVFRGAEETKLVAPNAIVEGESAIWVCRVEPDGKGTLIKNGVVVARGQMNIPKDIVRTQKYLGRSPWNDPILHGSVKHFTYKDLTPPPTTTTTTTISKWIAPHKCGNWGGGTEYFTPEIPTNYRLEMRLTNGMVHPITSNIRPSRGNSNFRVPQYVAGLDVRAVGAYRRSHQLRFVYPDGSKSEWMNCIHELHPWKLNQP